MSEDLTKKLPKRDSEKLDLIVTAVQALTSKTTSLEGNFALMQLRFDAIDSRLEGIDSRLNTIDSRLTGTESRLDTIDSRLTGIDSRLDTIDSRLNEIDFRVEALDKKVEERLYDTRPIWEQVVANVTQLQEGQQRLEASLYEGQKRIDKKLGSSGNGSLEIKTFLRDILRRMSIFNDTLLTIRADYRDIYDRVRHLELRNS